MFKGNGKREYNINTCQFSFYLSISVFYFKKIIISFTLSSSIRIVFRPFLFHSLFLVIINLSPVRFAVCRKRDSKPLY